MSSDGAFLAAASSIADRIVADAVWHGDRCNWTGAVVDPALPWRLEYRALEPNLYDGTAGVGLFLAQLAVVNGDAAVRRTARGALRQAIARAPALPPARRDGFHAGVLGDRVGGRTCAPGSSTMTSCGRAVAGSPPRRGRRPPPSAARTS